MPIKWYGLFLVIGLTIFVLSLLGKKGQSFFAHRVSNRQELLLNNLPLGLCLLSKTGKIIWANPLFPFLTGKKIVAGEDCPEFIHPSLLQDLGGKSLYFETRELLGAEEKLSLLTCQDLSEELRLYTKQKGYLPVIALAQIDNWAEVLKSMPEDVKPHLLGKMERTLREWVENLEGFLSRITEDRYLIILKQWGLQRAEKEHFNILDKIRNLEVGNGLPLTLSLGIGRGEEQIGKLGNLAQAALDIAQERGGDQVVAKSPEKVRFFGGKSLAMEKRTKVKARRTANALKEMILDSSQVLIMGHEMADYDSLGSALGVFKAVRDLGKKAWLIRDKHNPALDKILTLFPYEAGAYLVKAEEALRKMQEGTLVVVVDTHKPSLLPEPALLSAAAKVVLLDHHRRGEEFPEKAELIYLESYASSTCELVAELLQYMGEEVKIGPEEATALLAGITVDTKNFVYQTGARTFAAASYLRSKGADPTAVQKLFQDDLQTAIQKAEVISKARILYGEIAVSVGGEPSAEAQLLAAKAADAMLNIAGVNAAFVLWPFSTGVAISARSNGKINVQTIMEKLDGGGHLTIAAAQVPITLAEAEREFLNILEEVLQKSKEVRK
ncbi:MAG: DHH family phosphoesterase [Clostridia bacterium]|nr:DHH family phosphoesterase [Clostridia bacterium]MDD4145598.1 DHH family phosphoesterase [Clostridia bacterium]MDD4665225.1 DHH family phosphoesterase [Clostridia bacterium]